MKTLLLLAGVSRRFWPLEDKPLFPVCGKTLLEHQVERLRRGGCEEIILVSGAHNLEKTRRLFPDFMVIEQEDLSLGMRGALLSALPLCGDEPVLVVGGNDVIDPSAYAALRASKDGAILAKKVDRYFPGGYLIVENGRVTGIVEKPGEGKEPGNLINIVAHVHPSASELLTALRYIRKGRDDGYEQALEKLCRARNYRALPYEGIWQAVKFPWHMLGLLELLLGEIQKEKIAESAQIHPSAVITGNTIIGEDVKVLPHATIVGPCVIGCGSIIANNALVRQSSIGSHCVVGYSTEVKLSVLADHVWTHTDYTGDSVIGPNTSFGAGTITGNLRLDEKEVFSAIGGEKVNTGLRKFGTAIGSDCRLGIHVSINPGVKIGKGTFVSGGVLVTEDVEDFQFVSVKNGVTIVKGNLLTAPQPERRNEFKEKIV